MLKDAAGPAGPAWAAGAIPAARPATTTGTAGILTERAVRILAVRAAS
jgi:hypothetical protein